MKFDAGENDVFSTFIICLSGSSEFDPFILEGILQNPNPEENSLKIQLWIATGNPIFFPQYALIP